MGSNDETSGIVEEFVFLFGVEFFVGFFVLVEVFGQEESIGVAALGANEVGQFFDFFGFDECALYADEVGAGEYCRFFLDEDEANSCNSTPRVFLK